MNNDSSSEYSSSDVDIQQPDISLMEHHNIHADIRKIKMIKILEICGAVFVLNGIFATLCYFFLYGQISGATTYLDFYYFGLVTISTVGYGDMSPTTQTARAAISVYLVFLFSFVLSFAL